VSPLLSRRRFGSLGLVGLASKSERRVTGIFVDTSLALGHRLRDRGAFPPPKRTVRVPVLVIGGGVAGLSAAWRFHKRGFRDFVVLEMDKDAGGNSRYGENDVSAYPWAAHYVPVPGKQAALVRELMTDLGLLRNGAWEERHLCHAPQERLYLHGRWQEGIEPETGLTTSDREQFRRFHALTDELRAGGEFAIPMETGRCKLAALDRLSMDAWLREHRFDSTYLRWLVDYSCRDDYGAGIEATSAWAGLHYFAARGQAEDKGPLTWAEGNGWIIKRLLEIIGSHVRTGAFVWKIRKDGSRYRVLAGDTDYHADAVIFAAPVFLVRYLMDNAGPWPGEYSPWLTANLTLDRLPAEKGFPAAWDNVIYRSPALGYVVATHQSLRLHHPKTVWTYYWALAEGTPAEERRRLIEKDWGYWMAAILSDLSQAHPDIRQCVSRIDIMRLGPAMIRPSPGFIFSPDRAQRARLRGRLVFANSDLSGLSLFEEAQYRGVQAAAHILRVL
jgi:glycine/D-amino acid oxidase-like deaminating enzyme